MKLNSITYEAYTLVYGPGGVYSQICAVLDFVEQSYSLKKNIYDIKSLIAPKNALKNFWILKLRIVVFCTVSLSSW